MSAYLPEDRATALRAFAEHIAIKAGAITLEYFRGDFTTEWKADKSPVTVADREAEKFLRAEISTRFPEHAIIGEEFGETAGVATEKTEKEEYTWVLDPIDGTKSFIHGIPLYTVLVALLRNQEPVLGVIHNPPLSETVSAVRGHGCLFNGEACRVSDYDSLESARLQLTDAGDFFRREPQLATRLFEKVGFLRTWGDAYGYMLVATGRAEIMIDPVLSVWDVAALAPIIEEAGGIFSDIEGRYTGLGTSAVAAPAALHEAVMALR
ncbi:MAG: inositol monophosphatase family protein [Spirochaetia bacterium]